MKFLDEILQAIAKLKIFEGEHHQQLSFKYFEKKSLIPNLLSKVS